MPYDFVMPSEPTKPSVTQASHRSPGWKLIASAPLAELAASDEARMTLARVVLEALRPDDAIRRNRP